MAELDEPVGAGGGGLVDQSFASHASLASAVLPSGRGSYEMGAGAFIISAR